MPVDVDFAGVPSVGAAATRRAKETMAAILIRDFEIDKCMLPVDSFTCNVSQFCPLQGLNFLYVKMEGSTNVLSLDGSSQSR
jgi:hypothetical protein